MASLLRNTLSIVTRISCIRAATAPSGPGVSRTLSQLSRSRFGSNTAVQDARQRLIPSDAIRPKPIGETPFVPLVGTALNVWGQLLFGLFLSISAYFVYVNYITNPEFYKSLQLSREVSKYHSQEKSANHGSSGH